MAARHQVKALVVLDVVPVTCLDYLWEILDFNWYFAGSSFEGVLNVV